MSFLAACSSPPTLKKLEPADGRAHDVIFVSGDGREFAQIVWDVGTTSERIIPGPFLGAYMFSVPPDAVAGSTYDVALQNSAGRSESVTFTVPEPDGPLTNARPPGPAKLAFPNPRIDAVTVVGAEFDSSGVRTLLYVQGANMDIGATVWLLDPTTTMLTELATVSHKVLRNDWFDVSSEELGYPIYHYSSAIVALGPRSPGEEITIVVKNLDDEESERVKYTLPVDAGSLDSDGDGLLDKWETSGYDADGDGVVDIDLKGLGADPYRRDVFVELDIMDVEHRPDLGAASAADSTVFDALKKMFASAPILNVGTEPGIHLVIDASGKPCLPDTIGDDVCSFQFTAFSNGPPEPDPTTSGRVRFSQLKASSFRNDVRGDVYHYGIWGIQQAERNDSSGNSDFFDDFIISFDTWDDAIHTRRSQIEALAHELGHGLGQRHGGATHLPAYKPNYLSVMSYSWDLRARWNDMDRQSFATCLPFYYANPGAKEMNGAMPADVNTIVDYSEGMAKTLLRPAATGTSSFCGSTVHWTTLASNILKVEDYPNWRSLVFDGPAQNGGIP